MALTPKIYTKKLGIVSRDYRKKEKNGYRDFSYAFKDILTILDGQACDTVLFSLYTIEKRSSFNVKNFLNRLNISNIRIICTEEFKDGNDREFLEYVIYYYDKDQWKEHRLTQVFVKSQEVNTKQKNKMGYQFSSKALKKAELFKKQVLEDRLFGNFTILLCGETNIVSRKGKRVRKDLMKIKDPHKYRALLDKDIRVIFNPIHDRMIRPEMLKGREYLSKNNRWVISVWNKGRADKNGRVVDYKSHDWTVYYNGEAKECEPLQFNVDSQADIQIEVINLIGDTK